LEAVSTDSRLNSQFRVEKRRAEAELTLSSGHSVRGTFFLAGSCSRHAGPERIADLLNVQDGFFPFETTVETPGTLLINRAHVVSVRLLDQPDEPRLDPGYIVAPERHVSMLLSNGTTLHGAVRVYRPQGRDRLSDYAQSPEAFRYLESPDATFVVNCAHIVNFWETDS
jgi:hypothetical protein